ncbi:hypothetical protein FB446DRAFT_824907 [Lentinula raphanica]|nr:hypothetical protein FB446DRAFT_824907 [Lentinula raphanica]
MRLKSICFLFTLSFVQLVRKHFPHSLLHFEDYGATNAQRLLKRYRDTHAVFNDDIQGTGAVTLSTLMAAVGVTKSKLCDQRIIIYGAGSAGLGITKQLRDAMVSIDNISIAEANSKFWLIDKHGLITESLPDVREDLKEYTRTDDEWREFRTSQSGDEMSEIRLLDVVRKIQPTVLIGTSTHAGGFTREVVESMAAGCERPIIFPLSNPREGPALQDPDDALLPDFGDAPAINFEVAVAVAEQAIEEGSAGVDWKKEEVREKAREKLWQPVYGEYVYDENGEK